MPADRPRTVRQSFRPRARLLQILGDQLIGSPRLAVFELVKNAYDADASEVVVRIEDLDSDEPVITVQDDGYGMSFETSPKRQRTRVARVGEPLSKIEDCGIVSSTSSPRV